MNKEIVYIVKYEKNTMGIYELKEDSLIQRFFKTSFVQKVFRNSFLKKVFYNNFTEKIFSKSLNKVDLKKFYSIDQNKLIEGQYNIIPMMRGMTSTSYLLNKAQYNLEHNQSDFGMRTSWKVIITDENVSSKVIGDKTIYVGALKGILTISDYEGNTIMEGNYTYSYCDDFKMTPEILTMLYQNAANGVYQTARDTFNMLDAIFKERHGEGCKLKCDECGEIFGTIPEFFNHLIESKHHDSILDIHINDSEVIRIKNLLGEKSAE